MPAFSTAPLSIATWEPYAALIERHNGVWGGCWCNGFHEQPAGGYASVADSRAAKHARVLNGTTHAALVFDGDTCVGWCQYGPTATLPRIKNRKAYDATPTPPPDWRITCFFVDKTHRGQGVAAAALSGAVRAIAQLGGGTVEGYPEDTTNRKISGAFLWNGTLAMFEAQGFKRQRKIGKDRWVVTRLL
jgi:GNAT superfamily N-acetyltransferase